MASGISGQLLGLKVNGAFTSCEISCEFSFDQEMLPASAVDSGRFKEFIAGIRGWTMTVNGNLLLDAVPTDFKSLFISGYMQGLPMFVDCSTRPSVETIMSFSGNALLQSGNFTGPATGKANWNMVFQGTGAIKPTYVNLELLIDAMPALADYPIIVDEST